MQLKILVQENFFVGALFSQLHRQLVCGDANQPGKELGIFSEVGQILEGFQQGFLDRVFGISPVARDGLRDSEKSAAVSLTSCSNAVISPFLQTWTSSRSSLATSLTASCVELAIIFVQNVLENNRKLRRQRKWVRATVCNRHLDQNVLDIGLGIFHGHVEVAIFVEYAPTE
ncbi:MAG TPA: hypothetical protein VN833_29295 [Candidatus Acidoferrales bacterium]|nr:hypothetical protein [Candidatus Acidoferrales bacterium]